MSLQIYIDGDKLLDVEESNKGISLSSEVERVGQFGFVPSNSSQPFSVPKTRRNRSVLANLEDVFDIVIRAKDIEALKGKGKKTETDNRYNVDAWGTNANWITDLEDTSLADIATFANLTTVWSGANIDTNLSELATETTDPQTTTNSKAFAYFPILYRKQIDRRWNNEDLYPHINVFWFIEQGFLSQGWKIDSRFMAKTQFRRLYIPYCWGRFGLSDEYLTDNVNMRAETTALQTISISSGDGEQVERVEFDDESTAPNFDNGANYNNTTFLYTVPEKGIYEIEVSNLTVQSTQEGSEWVDFKLEIWAGGQLANAVTLEAHSDIAGPPYYFEVATLTALVELEASDTIYIDTVLVENPEATFISFSGNIQRGAILKINKKPYYLEGDTVTFADFLPKNTYFTDLLKGVKDCFNFKIVANPFTKVVTIEPRNRWVEDWASGNTDNGYFDETLTIENLTRIADQNTIKRLFFDDLPRQLIFKYKSDSRDGFLTKIEKETKVHPNQSTYNFNERFKPGSDTHENHFFAATVHGEVSTALASSVVMPIMIAENSSEVADRFNDRDLTFTPKLVYYKGAVTKTWNFRGIYQTTFYQAFSSNFGDSTGNDWNLAYSDISTDLVDFRGLATKYFHRQLFNFKLEYLEVGLKIGASKFAAFNHRKNYYFDMLQYVCIGLKGFKPLQNNFTKAVLFQNRYPLESDLDNFEHEPTPTLTTPPEPTEFVDADPCTLPCGGVYKEVDIITDFSSTMDDAGLQNYEIDSFIINGTEYISTNVPVLESGESKKVIFLEIDGAYYNYLATTADTLQTLVEDEDLDGFFTFMYSSVLISHGSGDSVRHIKIRYPSCWEWSFTIYDDSNSANAYRFSHDKGFERWDVVGGEYVQTTPSAYYNTFDPAPQNPTTLNLCE